MFNERVRKPVGRRPSTEGRKTFGLCVAAAALLCGFGLLHTWTRVAVTERGYQLAKARAESDRLHSELAKAQLEVEALQNAAKVERAAHDVLGMKKADRVLVLDKSRVAAQTPIVSGEAIASNGL